MQLSPNYPSNQKNIVQNSCTIINDSTGVFSYLFRSLQNALQITGKNVQAFKSGAEDNKQNHWIMILQYACSSTSQTTTVDAAPIVSDLNLNVLAPVDQLKKLVQTLPQLLVIDLFGIQHHCNSCQKTDTYQTINKNTTLYKKCQHCGSNSTHIIKLPVLLFFYPQCMQLGVKLNIHQQLFYLNSVLTANNNSSCYSLMIDSSTSRQEEFALSNATGNISDSQIKYLKPDLVREYLLTTDTQFTGSNALFSQIGPPQLCIYINSDPLPMAVRQKIDVSLTLRGTAVDTVRVLSMKQQTGGLQNQQTVALTPGLQGLNKSFSQLQSFNQPPTSNLQATPSLKRIDGPGFTNVSSITPVIRTNPDINQINFSGYGYSKSQVGKNTVGKSTITTSAYSLYVCTTGWIFWLFFGLSCALMIVVCVLMGIHQGRLNGTITMNNVNMNEAMLVGLINVKSINDARLFIQQADAIAGTPPQPLQSSEPLNRLGVIQNSFTTYTNFLSVGQANSANIEFHNVSTFNSVSCLDTALNIPGTVNVGNYIPPSITAQTITAQNVITSDFSNSDPTQKYPAVEKLIVNSGNVNSFEANSINLSSATAGSAQVTTTMTAGNLLSSNTNAINYTVHNNLTTGAAGNLSYMSGTIQAPTVATNTITVLGRGNPTQSAHVVLDDISLQNNGGMLFQGSVQATSLTCTGLNLVMTGNLTTPSATMNFMQGAANATATTVPALTAPAVTCDRITAQTLTTTNLNSSSLSAGAAVVTSLESSFLGFSDTQFVANQLAVQFSSSPSTGPVSFTAAGISAPALNVNGLTSSTSAIYGPANSLATIDLGIGGTVNSGSLQSTNINANSYTGNSYTATGNTQVTNSFTANKIIAGSFGLQNGTQIFGNNVTVDNIGSAMVCQGNSPQAVTKC